MRYREVARALEAEGWSVIRQTGSHVIFERDGRICPVPNHSGKDLKFCTVVSIERITGVKLR